VGFAGLVSFLRLQGVPVLLSRGVDADDVENASLVILTPTLDNSSDDVLAVSDFEPKLIILPKWQAAPDPLRAGWVRKAGTIPAQAIADRLLRSASESTVVAQATATAPVHVRNGFGGTEAMTPPIESLQTLSGAEWTGYVTDQADRWLVAKLDGSETYVLSDPDLMNTHGLSDLNTARLAATIIDELRAGDGPVVFDLTLSGYRRSPNLLRLAFEPPLLGATVCALLAALLMGVHASVRFGAPLVGRRALALGKQALADNSAALIEMAGREHRIAPRYAAAVRRRVAHIVGVPSGARDEELDEQLDRLRRRNDGAPSIAALVAEAQEAKDATDALKAARKLHGWRRSMLHES
jgi:hypothetical protein